MDAADAKDESLVTLGGAMLYEEDHKQVLLRQKRTGKKFAESVADYVRDLREYLKKGEGISRG